MAAREAAQGAVKPWAALGRHGAEPRSPGLRPPPPTKSSTLSKSTPPWLWSLGLSAHRSRIPHCRKGWLRCGVAWALEQGVLFPAFTPSLLSVLWA